MVILSVISKVRRRKTVKDYIEIKDMFSILSVETMYLVPVKSLYSSPKKREQLRYKICAINDIFLCT